MSFLKICRSVLLTPLCLLAALEVKPATAQTLTGSNFDSRVLVAMRLDADAVQAAMPEGWTLFPFPGGALEGANSLLIFADRNLGMDAEGMPNDPASYRAMAMASLGKSTTTDEVRTFVTRVYTTVGGNDPYGNARPASISRRAAVESMDGEQPKFTEEWSLLSDGGKMSLSLSYTAGPLSWATRESQSYSNVDPSIHHLNRFEQLSDLAMSAPLGKALDGELEINSSIPELAALFDGKESTIAVIVIPMYVREVFEPEGLTCLISPASFAGEITFGSGLGNRLSLRNIASGTSTASPSPLRDQRRCSLDKQHDVANLFPTLGELYSIPTLRTKRLLLRSSERSVLFRSLPRFIPTFKLGFWKNAHLQTSQSRRCDRHRTLHRGFREAALHADRSEHPLRAPFSTSTTPNLQSGSEAAKEVRFGRRRRSRRHHAHAENLNLTRPHYALTVTHAHP